MLSLATTNIWLGGLTVLALTAIAIGVMLRVRQRAPRGGYFSDSDRAASIFSCIGTMFSVLLALVIFLSVETYSATQSHANAEADSVLEQFQLAQLFPSQDQYLVQSQLICYGRSVAHKEWPLMKDNRHSPIVDGWALSLDATIDSVEVDNSKAEAAFQLFLTQTLQRQEERRGRLEGAEGALPATVWPILFLGAIAIVAYMVAYADRRERVMSQAFQIGVVTLLLGASLLLINALDHPFGANPGQIKPEKMLTTVGTMQQYLSSSIDTDELEATLPCNLAGIPPDTGPVASRFLPGSTMDQIADRGKITIGVSYSVRLFGLIDPISGRLNGFDADLGREIARELGLRQDQVEFVELISPDRIPALLEDRVDIVISTMTINADRLQQIDFSRPYFLAGQSVLIKRGNQTISSVRHLEGKRACVVPETTSERNVRIVAPQVQLMTTPTWAECVAALNDGRVEAVTTDDIILAGFAAADDDLQLVGGQFTREPYGVGVKKGKEDLVQFINDLIDRMLADGRWGRLYYEYLGDISGLASVSDAKAKLPERYDQVR
jgi:ABC-type amino acid transport substrate-binding protein